MGRAPTAQGSWRITVCLSTWVEDLRHCLLRFRDKSSHFSLHHIHLIRLFKKILHEQYAALFSFNNPWPHGCICSNNPQQGVLFRIEYFYFLNNVRTFYWSHHSFALATFPVMFTVLYFPTFTREKNQSTSCITSYNVVIHIPSRPRGKRPSQEVQCASPMRDR